MKITGTVDQVHEASGTLHVVRVKFNSGGFAKLHVAPGELKAGDAIEVVAAGPEKAKK